MEFEFITESGESYLFWIRRKSCFNPQTQLYINRIVLTTRPHGYICEIIKTDNGYEIDWENWSGNKLLGRRYRMSKIPGYVEHLEKFVKLMVFI